MKQGEHMKTAYHRKRMSDLNKKQGRTPPSRKGVKWSIEARKRISKQRKGSIPWNKGFFGYKMPPASEKRKKKISIALKKNNGQRGKPPWNKNLIGYMAKEKHWNWKNGITPINTKIRNSPEGKQWRIDVFRRDHFLCQMPGCKNKRGSYIIAHHIKKFSKYPELRFVVSNGMTLCKNCDARVYRHEEEYETLFLQIIKTKYG